MTHDTPDGSADKLRWCDRCRLEVVPRTTSSKEVCPSCRNEL